MLQVAVHHAAQRAGNLADRVATVAAAAVAAAAVDIASASHARCIPPPVQVVVKRHKCLSSHAKTGRCTAATATSHKGRDLAAVAEMTAVEVIAALAGKLR